MSLQTLYVLCGIAAATVTIVTGIRHAGRWLARTVAAAAAFRKSVDDNTQATAELAAEFRQHRADVGAVLADHAHRLEALETR